MRNAAQAWLNDRLGPGSPLPYAGQDRARIIEQLTDLTQVGPRRERVRGAASCEPQTDSCRLCFQEFSSLTVQTQTYTYTNGRSVLGILLLSLICAP